MTTEKLIKELEALRDTIENSSNPHLWDEAQTRLQDIEDEIAIRTAKQ